MHPRQSRRFPGVRRRGISYFDVVAERSVGSVGAELHGSPVERLVLVTDGFAAIGDAIGATGLDLTEERAVLDQDLALVEGLCGIELELGARVCDVEVAHGQ